EQEEDICFPTVPCARWSRRRPREELRTIVVDPVRHGGDFLVGVVVVVRGQSDLLEVVAALHACGGLADLLDGREQEADQDRDDGNHDQQLDERERSSARLSIPGHGKSSPVMTKMIQPGPVGHDAGEKTEPLAKDRRSTTLLAAGSWADSRTVSRTDSI